MLDQALVEESHKEPIECVSKIREIINILNRLSDNILASAQNIDH